MKKGVVSEIRVYTEKGRPGEQKERVMLLEGKGIAGDRHADGSDRQISVCFSEVRNWMKAQEEPGLCFARYKENLLFSGMPANLIKAGTEIRIGEALLEITPAKKKCFPECSFFSEGKTCLLSTGACHARVVETGQISVGDEVVFSRESDC